MSGVDTATPQLTNLTHCPATYVHLSVGGKCPAGSFCESGSKTYTACPAGKYTPNTGFPACEPCPAGYYCLNETSDYSSNRCPMGHYCPEGTRHSFEFPCSPGTFNPNDVSTNATSCLPCTPGKYCEGSGNSAPTNSCSAGYYCPGGVDNPKPSHYKCPVRHYCPFGSPHMMVCTGGSYCESEGLENPSDLCERGFYCPNGSLSARERECLTGHYCPQGSDLPLRCPIGTFLSGRGAFNENECLNCTAGFYCNTTGLNAVSGPCAPGFYCPPGQAVQKPNNYQCTKGHLCKEGSTLPTRCENGTYQDQETQWACKECMSGYFCDNTVTPVESLNGSQCPMGHYCPKGTRYSNQYPCLSGSWSNQTGLRDAQSCDDCPPM